MNISRPSDGKLNSLGPDPGRHRGRPHTISSQRRGPLGLGGRRSGAQALGHRAELHPYLPRRELGPARGESSLRPGGPGLAQRAGRRNQSAWLNGRLPPDSIDAVPEPQDHHPGVERQAADREGSRPECPGCILLLLGREAASRSEGAYGGDWVREEKEKNFGSIHLQNVSEHRASVYHSPLHLIPPPSPP
jgi:hypothetical protein